MEDKIKEFFSKHNIKIYGWCNFQNSHKSKILLPVRTLEKIKSVVVFGVPLSKAVIENLVDGPDLIYLHHYRQANYFLDRTAFLLSSFLEEKNFFTIPIPASQIIDWRNQKAHLSHKYFAHLCGIGWLGRNNLIVNPVYRSRLRFATILTSIRFNKNSEILDFVCGNCKKCIEICPAGAISENPETFNHIACFEKIKQLAKQNQISQYICGLCIKACEYGNNKKTNQY